MNFGSRTGRRAIKDKIIKNQLLPYKCSECSITEWNGKTLALHLDHVNGIHNDNRLENLRFLCPNCHSQTPTYCGKNNKIKYSTKRLKVSDDELLEAIKNSSTITEALDSVGLSGGRNFDRVKRLAAKYDYHHITKHSRIQAANKEKIKALRKSNIDFSKYGWVGEAAKILEISPQKTRKFIERYDPDLIENSKHRAT